MVQEDLASLSLDQLIWSMVLRLNWSHSTGGVSGGRELRSACLEIALGYNNHYDMLGDIANDEALETDPLDFVTEARTRSESASELLLFETLTLSQATDRQLVESAMHEMGKWYDKDRKREDRLNDTEYELAKEIVRLLTPHWVPIYQDSNNKVAELQVAWEDRKYEWSEVTLWSRYQALREI